MNRRLLFVLMLAGALRGVSTANAAADPEISSTYKTDPDPSSHRAEIATAVNKEVTKLSDDTNAADQSAARDWLVGEALLKNNAEQTSSGYIDIYTDSLNKAFVVLLAKPTTTGRDRVLVGIITEKVAEHSNNVNLVPTVEKLLGDPSDAVALWASRGASALAPRVYQDVAGTAANRDKYMEAMVNAVLAHSKTTQPASSVCGSIAEEVYRGLTPPKTPLTNDILQSMMKYILQVQAARLDLYKTDIPDNPNADTFGSIVLLGSKYWDLLSDKQKLAAMQSASDLISMAGQRAAQRPANLSEDLILAITHESQLINGLATAKLNDADLAAATLPAMQLKIGTRPDAIRQACEPIFSAIAKSGNTFDELKAPPDLTTPAATTAPITPAK